MVFATPTTAVIVNPEGGIILDHERFGMDDPARGSPGIVRELDPVAARLMVDPRCGQNQYLG